jgi:hypothetical protein
MANPVVDSIVSSIMGEAVAIGGQTFQKIRGAMRQRARFYATTLAAIATHLASGEITPQKAAQATKNAAFTFALSVSAQVQQIALAAVQKFLNTVIAAATGAINAALPIPIL